VGHERHCAADRSAPPDCLNVAIRIRQGREGNTLGGVRTPQVDAPVAVLSGSYNSAANSNLISMFCFLFGSTVPYSSQHVATLYKNHGQFVKSWTQDINRLVSKGFLLEPDGNELQQSAVHSHIGK
jgi:hypothetical protein